MKIVKYEVDWDSYESVSKLGNIIKSRCGELNPNRISKREKNRQILEACDKILSTDISCSAAYCLSKKK